MTNARELDATLLDPAIPASHSQIHESDISARQGTQQRARGFPEHPPTRNSFRNVLFGWVWPLLRQAITVEKLELHDLFLLPVAGQPEQLYNEFIEHWRKSLAGGRNRRPGRQLLRVLFQVHFPRLKLLWFGRLVQAALGFAYPLGLYLLIKFVKDDNSQTWHGLVIVFIWMSCFLAVVLIEQNVDLGMKCVALQIRSSLTSAIYHKVLVLRQDTLLDFSSGRLNNMITTDVNKAKRILRYMHVLVLAPLTLVVCLVSLYKLVGVSAFIGLGWMGFVICINPLLMNLTSKLEDRQQSKTDERVRKVTETISAIKVVKIFAWESPALRRVRSSRQAELKSMFNLYILYIVFETLWASVKPVTTALMFTAYVLLNKEEPLTSDTAFAAMALLDMLQEPLFTIPWISNLAVEALVAAKRLERLFDLPETCLPAVGCIGTYCEHGAGSPSTTGEGTRRTDSGPRAAIQFTGESFQWPRSGRDAGAFSEDEAQSDGDASSVAAGDSNTGTSGEGSVDSTRPPAAFRLSNLHLEIPHGVLVGVVGGTASGKSSLLQAILGEMPEVGATADEVAGRESAAVFRHVPIAYSPQQPWIFNSSVRSNIVFSEGYNESLYKECLRCCDLERDMELLQDGDQTKVGEKGIALSGGQKARICLARAAYLKDKCNLILLDDPYSALDAHVARKVHDDGIIGLLARKTRVVVTNRLEFTSDCDLIIVMDGGRVDAVGTYSQIFAQNAIFRTLLAAHSENLPSNSSDQSSTESESDKTNHDSGSEGRLVRTTTGSTGCQFVLERDVSQESNGSNRDAPGNEEERETGSVKKDVIWYYTSKMGGPCALSLLASMYIISEMLTLALPFWVALWTSKGPNQSELEDDLRVYVVLSLTTVFFMSLRDLIANMFGFRAARRLHADLLASLLRAPLAFFQDTPHGRIINRFSNDMSEIDKDLVWQLIYTVVPVVSVVGNLCMLAVVAFWGVLFFIPALWLYYKCWKCYNKAAVDVKRITKTTSSPVYDNFHSLCAESAVCTVRAHWQVGRESRSCFSCISDQQRSEYSLIYLECWYCMCVELLGILLCLLVSIFVVFARGKLVTPGTAALSLMYAWEVADSIQDMIGEIAEFGMAFTCVERVKEYATALVAEAPLETDRRPPSGWPSRGDLVVGNLAMRYRTDSPLVLKGISFSVCHGERLGIVGRTGAGKSSLLLALLRLVEPEEGSCLTLDGEDLLGMGLRDLRSNIAVIPQEGVLFMESLRFNCDPFDQHGSVEIWQALQDAQLASWVLAQSGRRGRQSPSRFGTRPRSENDEAVQNHQRHLLADNSVPLPGESFMTAASIPENLDVLLRLEIKESGQNLSAGQRQMVAIARAVLRKSKLVVLDEATAALDSVTDSAVQLAVRRCFHGSTTLTIAHRLNTIMDSDRILVLDAGEVAELGTPAELQGQSGVFKSLVEESVAR